MVFMTLTESELRDAGVLSENESASDIALHQIPAIMLRVKRQEVIDAYCKQKGFTPEELAEYEFGIDEWIGFGSVTCFELGGGTMVGFGYNEIQMAII